MYKRRACLITTRQASLKSVSALLTKPGVGWAERRRVDGERV